MGSSSPALSNMQFLVLLSAVAMAFASPIPEEGMEAPEALAYVHDATGDVAVDDSPAALPYVHDATGDVADVSSPEAEAYVHDATGELLSPTFTWSPLLPPLLPLPPSPTPPTLTPTVPTPTLPLVPTLLLPLLLR